MKRKLLIITPIFPPRTGGPSTYTWELSKRLKKKYKVTVLCFADQVIRPDRIRVVPIQLSKGTIYRQLRLLLQCFRFIPKSDIIYIQGPLVVGFVSVIVSWIFHKISLMKVVGDEAWEALSLSYKTRHNLEEFHAKKTRWFYPSIMFQKFSLSLVPTIVTPSQYLKQFLTTSYQLNPTKIIVVPNAVEIDESLNARSKKKYLITSIGRLVPHKHFEKVILSMQLLQKEKKFNQYRLHIAGEGPEKEKLERLISKLRITKSAELIGRKNKQEVYKILQSSQALVLASDYEGLSHVIIESMLLGTPIIATDIPGNREILTHGITGYLFSSSVNELANAMKIILSNDILRNKLIKNAKKEATEKFNWENHTKRLIYLFREEFT
ncbi:MAG: hypothetical protein A2W30_05640 [Ignavibacteria bacterium RBG_16_36_9]|nr:MAG: hypothetical protein A2W30_05640 [Ignavibacteria bacterium RBG_16_36_9]